MNADTVPLQTVARAFEVLDLLERENEAGPARIASLMNVNRSTAHDYLVSLESTGYVVKSDGKYRISYRFLQRGSRLKYRNQFFHSSEIVLAKLSEQSGELAQLGQEEGGEWRGGRGEGGEDSQPDDDQRILHLSARTRARWLNPFCSRRPPDRATRTPPRAPAAPGGLSRSERFYTTRRPT